MKGKRTNLGYQIKEPTKERPGLLSRVNFKKMNLILEVVH
jgi:hypothetical protein